MYSWWFFTYETTTRAGSTLRYSVNYVLRPEPLTSISDRGGGGRTFPSFYLEECSTAFNFKLQRISFHGYKGSGFTFTFFLLPGLDFYMETQDI